MAASNSNSSTADLLRTPLYDLHVQRKARMVPFAGYSMPVQYPAGLMAEHKHTRSTASWFDVSHMGQLMITGAHAAEQLEKLLPVDVIGLPVGKQTYGLLLNEQGGILDDLMLLRLADDTFFMVVNAACKATDIPHIRAVLDDDVQVEELTERALIAVQGPKAVEIVASFIPAVTDLRFMLGGRFVWDGVELIASRSGYTGEDGLEVSVPAEKAEAFIAALEAAGDVQPAGLGARNSLRLESGLCLYGSDMTSNHNPVEANLKWAVSKVRRADGARAGGYVGADVVLAAWGEAPKQKRVALKAQQRVPVRDGTSVVASDSEGAPQIGHITSGLLSPTLDVPIAFAYVDAAHAKKGNTVYAQVRGKHIAMEVVTGAFVPQNYVR